MMNVGVGRRQPLAWVGGCGGGCGDRGVGRVGDPVGDGVGVCVSAAAGAALGGVPGAVVGAIGGMVTNVVAPMIRSTARQTRPRQVSLAPQPRWTITERGGLRPVQQIRDVWAEQHADGYKLGFLDGGKHQFERVFGSGVHPGFVAGWKRGYYDNPWGRGYSDGSHWCGKLPLENLAPPKGATAEYKVGFRAGWQKAGCVWPLIMVGEVAEDWGTY